VQLVDRDWHVGAYDEMRGEVRSVERRFTALQSQILAELASSRRAGYGVSMIIRTLDAQELSVHVGV
jgi:hypothetical protein